MLRPDARKVCRIRSIQQCGEPMPAAPLRSRQAVTIENGPSSPGKVLSRQPEPQRFRSWSPPSLDFNPLSPGLRYLLAPKEVDMTRTNVVIAAVLSVTLLVFAGIRSLDAQEKKPGALEGKSVQSVKRTILL